MKLQITSKLFLCILAIFPLTSCFAITSEADIEDMLVEFYNEYLPCVDFKTTIDYPTQHSPDYYLAWSGLVISVCGDVALILSGGGTELIVKMVEGADAAYKAVKISKILCEAYKQKSLPGGEAIEFVVVNGGIYAIEKAVGSKIPLVRIGYNTVKLFTIASKDREYFAEKIREQKNIMKFAVSTVPAAVAIKKAISELPPSAKKKEYEEILNSMLNRAAEVATYRQIIQKQVMDKNPGTLLAYNINHYIDQFVNPGLGGKYTIDYSIVQLVNSYIEGKFSKKVFINGIKNYIAEKMVKYDPVTGRKMPVDKDDVEKIFGLVSLEQIEDLHDKMNKYGGANTCYRRINNFHELDNYIDEFYRIRVKVMLETKVDSLIPRIVKGSAPNQGTVVPNNIPKPSLNIYSESSILFLLDVSGSMGQKLKNDPNQTRIDAAKTALVEVVDELAKDQNTEFGVLAFGTEGCNTEFITKFTHNAEIVRQTIAPLKPRGATPIEKAIREGANILRNRTNAGRLVLILISDGQETCGGDPVKAAAECCGGGRQPDYEEKKIVDILQFIKLAYADNRNKFIEFAVIAFDADSISRGQLRKIAEAGNGKFVEASNVEELIGAITGTVRSSFVSHGDNSIWYLILMIIFAGIVVVGIKAIKMKSFLSSPNKFWGIITIKNNLGSSSLKLYKRKIIIGRASDCDIVIDDPYISKKHAQIQFKDGVAYIIDLGSKNGTFVDNRRISSQPLSSGATIKIGETKIKFQFKQN